MTSPSDRAVVDLNRVLEALPRLTVDVGHRRVPVFRSLGVALGVCAVAGASFFVWGLLRRAVTHLTFPLPRPADSGAGGYFGRRPAARELAGVP